MGKQTITNRVEEMKCQREMVWRAKNWEHNRQYDKEYWEKKIGKALAQEVIGNE